MPLRGISMRWWLALAFALIASLTAVAVATVFTLRAENAFRDRAEELTTGRAVAAANDLKGLQESTLDSGLQDVARRRRLALFAFDLYGQPLTGDRSRGVAYGSIDLHRQALEEARVGDRFVRSTEDGRTIVVGLPVDAAGASALVAVASRPCFPPS